MNIIQFLNQNFPNFNPENEQDLIRAEKLLKAESKLNGTFTNSEIEDFLFKVKNQKDQFLELLKFESIQKIVNGKIPDEEDEKPDFENFSDEEIDGFSEFYSDSVLEILDISIRKNQWHSLNFFVTNFYHLLNFNAKNHLITILKEKSYQIIDNLDNFKNLESFKDTFPFAVLPEFYSLLSTTDNFLFEEKINIITNKISSIQNNTNQNKYVLGQMLVALESFESKVEETKALLKGNSEVGKQWLKLYSASESKILKKMIAYFAKYEDEKLQNILLSIFFLALFFSPFIYLAFNNIVWYFIYNIITIFFLHYYRKNLKLFVFGSRKPSILNRVIRICFVLFQNFINSFITLFGLMFFYLGLELMYEDFENGKKANFIITITCSAFLGGIFALAALNKYKNR